jgi:hypothetical protein
MAINIAGEIEKEFNTTFSEIQLIDFGFNTIEIKPKILILQKLALLIGITGILGFIFFINPPVIFIAILLAISVSSLIYNYYSLLDKITIDFNYKEISLHNKLWIVTRIRKIAGKTVMLPFADISHFEVQYSKYSIFSPTQNRLLVKSFDKPPLLIGSFQFEINARRLGELLQYHITGKTRGLQA